MDNEYENLLLSITSKYDKRKNEQFSKEAIEVKKELAPLTDEEENAKLLRYFLEKNTGNWTYGYAKDGIREVSAFKKDGYVLLYYKKDFKSNGEWVLKKSGSFLVRFSKIKLNLFRVKMKPEILRCINISTSVQEKIRKKLVVNKYCFFILDYDDCTECIDELFAMNSRQRNSLV